MLGDGVLVCVLGCGYIDVEMVMIEIQRSTIVQENQQRVHTAKQPRALLDQPPPDNGR